MDHLDWFLLGFFFHFFSSWIFNCLLSLHHLLLAHLGFFLILPCRAPSDGRVNVLLSLFVEILPDDLEDLIGILRSDRRSHLLALEPKFDELGLVSSVVVEGEPIVEEFGGYTPTVDCSIGRNKSNELKILNEDGLGGGKGEIVLLDDNEVFVDGDLLVKVENF